MKHPLVGLLLALVLLSVTACGDYEASDNPAVPLTETPTPVAQATATPPSPIPATPSAEPTPTLMPSPTPEGPASSAPVELELSAQGMQFDKQVLGPVPAGAAVVLTFRNEDPMPHNVAIYHPDDMSTALFSGEVFLGPETMVYEFQAPAEPGEYVFVCEPHMGPMRGTFQVAATADAG
jgi:plastocyanin